jgi:hypothetical protein
MLDFQRSGCSVYGASMGRSGHLDRDTSDPCFVRKVPIDDQGYDPGGAYWGTPADLYMVESLESGDRAYLRARTMTAARAEFPQATWEDGPADMPAEYDAADMLQAYITAALWSSNDESNDQGGEPLDANYSADDLAPETLAKMTADVNAFLAAHAADIGVNAIQAGHDLWLTRTRSGVGFADRREVYTDAARQRLDDAAEALGERHLYIGDDGKIYQE